MYISSYFSSLYILHVYVFQVRKARNAIMHTADMKLSDADLKTYSQAMIDLLKDPGISCFKTAQHAVTEIQTVCMINENTSYLINTALNRTPCIAEI